MPSDNFCRNFLQGGQITLIPSPDCFICIAGSETIYVHMAIWLCGHMIIFWPYGWYSPGGDSHTKNVVIFLKTDDFVTFW
jgi:hypothetical protein